MKQVVWFLVITLPCEQVVWPHHSTMTKRPSRVIVVQKLSPPTHQLNVDPDRSDRSDKEMPSRKDPRRVFSRDSLTLASFSVISAVTVLLLYSSGLLKLEAFEWQYVFKTLLTRVGIVEGGMLVGSFLVLLVKAFVKEGDQIKVNISGSNLFKKILTQLVYIGTLLLIQIPLQFMGSLFHEFGHFITHMLFFTPGKGRLIMQGLWNGEFKPIGESDLSRLSSILDLSERTVNVTVRSSGMIFTMFFAIVFAMGGAYFLKKNQPFLGRLLTLTGGITSFSLLIYRQLDLAMFYEQIKGEGGFLPVGMKLLDWSSLMLSNPAFFQSLSFGAYSVLVLVFLIRSVYHGNLWGRQQILENLPRTQPIETTNCQNELADGSISAGHILSAI